MFTGSVGTAERSFLAAAAEEGVVFVTSASGEAIVGCGGTIERESEGDVFSTGEGTSRLEGSKAGSWNAGDRSSANRTAVTRDATRNHCDFQTLNKRLLFGCEQSKGRAVP